jgi:L,D-transpeptidase ErfK/SrfK
MNSRLNLNISYASTIILTVVLFFSFVTNAQNFEKILFENFITQDTTKTIIVPKNIKVKDYFKYLDSIVNKYNISHSYTISEHLLVRYNPWIIDTLANTDYYRMMVRDSFVFNQKEMVVLQEGVKLKIPDSIEVKKMLTSFDNTRIDINIPEYKLRIYEDSLLLFEFPVRVGRNEKKYLAMSGKVQDLRTKTGSGTVVAHARNPDYYNPVNGHQYFLTNRDDKKVTKLPQIPFIETEINDVRYGQLIHPTTNPETLGKAYSNGCIGTRESDAWVIYYYAPISTKIMIRYDLNIIDASGIPINLKDIYKKFN